MRYQTRTMLNLVLDDLFFTYTLFLFCIFYVNHACNQIDRNSLLSLACNTSSPSLNWSSNDCCLWEGISCDHTGHVTSILLPSKGLKGSISLSFTNFTHLSHLNLSHNLLSGPLPTGFFSSLNQLRILDLSYNHLGGDISLLSLSNNSSNGGPAAIQMLDLSSNQFNGAIQSPILNRAWNLTKLNVSNNSFTGPIPSSLCINSPFIKLLDFSHNLLGGQILSGLGACSKLKVFRAGFNSLSGTLPQDIYNATGLEQISLPSNDFSGSISNHIVNLSKLTNLELSDNEFTGKLPVNIGKLSKLKLLLLQMNFLTGSLPSSLMNCTNLVKLNLRYNRFEGDISAFDFSHLHVLTVLDLGRNDFSGNLPTSLYSCKSLKAIRLCQNRLEGQIRPEVRQLKFLSFLSVAYNRLTNITGAIKILMSCKTLNVLFLTQNFLHETMPTDGSIVGSDGLNIQVLGLGSCQLNGQLPIWMSKLKNLEVLCLSFNRLTGPIPVWLSTLPKLFHLDLSSNLISGEFPKELCGLSALVSEQARAPVQHNYLDIPIIFYNNGIYSHYNYITNIPQGILIGNNSIRGNIPTKIGRLQCLLTLDLSHNSFSGNIPDQISKLTNLEELDLSANQLFGEIPASLASLHFLSRFSVANNNLHGPIPTGTQLQSFSASAYEGNPGLCGSPLQDCAITGSSNSGKDIQGEEDGLGILWLHVSVAVGFVTGFWGVSAPLLFNYYWRTAYFQFLDNVRQRLVVLVVAYMGRFHGSNEN